jgi:hypothetical protein
MNCRSLPAPILIKTIGRTGLRTCERPTAWLRMQSEAKRSRGRLSLQFAICREIFGNCRESRSISCQLP